MKIFIVVLSSYIPFLLAACIPITTHNIPSGDVNAFISTIEYTINNSSFTHTINISPGGNISKQFGYTTCPC